MDTLKSLQTARVVIVDDDPDEGNALQFAFARQGVGAVYLNGDPTDVPIVPLTGVRLLVLDMKLAGESAEDKVTLARLLTVVPKVIHADNGPFVLVAWTKHQDLVEPFMAHLLKDHPALFPLAVSYIAKSDVLTSEKEEIQSGASKDVDAMFSPLENNIINVSDELFSSVSGTLERLKAEVRHLINGTVVRTVVTADVPKLVEKLAKSLADSSPLTILVDWEKRVHTAVSDTSLALFRLSTPPCATALAQSIDSGASGPKDTLLALEQTAATELGSASSAEHPGTGSIIQLTEEQQALLVKVVTKWDAALEQVLALLVQASGGKSLTESAEATGEMAYRSLMNGLEPIMVDQLQSRFGDLEGLVPRTEQLLSTAKKLTGSDKEKAGVLNRMLLVARIEKDTRPQLGNVYIDLLGQSSLFTAAGVNLQLMTDNILPANLSKGVDRETTVKACVPVLVDITPACDYAQDKVGLVRLIAGLLIKDVNGAGADYHKDVGIIRFDKSAGDHVDGLYRLVLDARFVTGRPEGELGEYTPSFRLRRQPIVSVQAWCSAHGARPGYTSVTV